jgi:DNA-directed RNA polymerase I and III subunit RPAC1
MSNVHEDQKPRLRLEEYKIKEDARDYGFNDEIFSREKFKQNIKIEIVKRSDLEIEFDVINVTPAIANAFRRLMLSEVPSMAIEKVYIYNNTSIIQDEILAHRLGLIPLKADSRLFEYKLDEKDDEGNELDTLEFKLDVKCTWKNKDNKDLRHPDAMYKNHNIYTEHIKWVPRGKQASLYAEANVGPCEDKILISKMRPVS